MFKTEENIERAILIAVNTGEFDSASSLDELAELAETAGAEVICSITQNLATQNKVTYMGPGKLEELKQQIAIHEIDLIIADDELSGIQLRNLEKATDIKVVDRTMLILDIFASRAISNEGKLQVELARQKYRLPRLVGLGASLSKQQGGIGSRGSGESQLEYDRRHIRRRITTLQAELDELASRRERMRDRRKKNETPTIAIVGYTNVGKSTLLNRLTNSEVFASDMLFATLDPTTRGLTLPDGQEALIIDTVGLLRRLPHQLVQAFHSTLEVATNADLILHVCDISSSDAMVQLEVTRSLLDELSCGDIKTITVYNKIDKLEGQNITPVETKGLAVSATTGQGIDKLLSLISTELLNGMKRMKLLIPYSKGDLLDTLRNSGKLFSETYENDGTMVDLNVDKRYFHMVEEFEIK